MSKDRPVRDERANVELDGGGINLGVAIVGFILFFLAGAGIMWGIDVRHQNAAGTTADTSDPSGAWSDEESPVPVTSRDPMWGSRTAPVTIVQFSDFECPYCSRVEPTLDKLKSVYGSDKIRILWKNRPLPMHPHAKPAAEAAMGVFALKGSDAFWKFHDVAFQNQSSLSPESYEAWAQATGVDMVKWKAGVAAHTWADKVEKDDAIATQINITGTPASLINGVTVSGAQPYEKFKAVVDQELQKAQAKLAAGTPKDKIYVVMSRANKENAPAAPEDDSEDKKDTVIYNVPVGQSPVKGPANALVTVVEFSDFQCPYCSRVEPALQAVHDKYGDKVRFVWKNEPLPFHPRAEPAAEVAIEAQSEKGDKGFWDIHDKLFASQPHLDEADLEKVATDSGLDLEKVRSAMKSHKYKAVIDGDADLGDDVAASGTPHFFINGHRLVGSRPLEDFVAMIDDELKNAESLVAKGVPADKLYETIIKDGKGAPPLEKRTMSVPPNAPSRGNPNAKVTIVEYSDFQCPFCKKAEESVTEVMKNYGTKVKLVWRNMPLRMHQDAPLAAEASMEAFKQKGSDGFWKMHDLLYANQPSAERQDGLKREALDSYALQLGLDMNKWKAALDTGSHKPEVDADAKAGADVNLQGTPAFLINGYFIDGAQPYAKFHKAIEKALAEAK